MQGRQQKTAILIGLSASVGFIIFLLGLGLVKRPKKERVKESPFAVGLRGHTKVTRPLTNTQEDRLEEHFENVPSLPVVARGTTRIHPYSSLIENIRQVNRFNRSQQP